LVYNIEYISCPAVLRKPGYLVYFVASMRVVLARAYWKAQREAEEQAEEEMHARAAVEEAEMIAEDKKVEKLEYDKKGRLM
jgi:hypothetical protein